MEGVWVGVDKTASSSFEDLSQSGHRTCSKTKGRGQVVQSLSPVKSVIGSKITGCGLVVKKDKYLGLRQRVLH